MFNRTARIFLYALTALSLLFFADQGVRADDKAEKKEIQRAGKQDRQYEMKTKKINKDGSLKKARKLRALTEEELREAADQAKTKKESNRKDEGKDTGE